MLINLSAISQTLLESHDLTIPLRSNGNQSYSKAVRLKNALFEEFNVHTLHTATLYTILKLIVGSLRFGMMWSVKFGAISHKFTFYNHVNPKSTGLFPPGAALGVFSTPLCKIRSRHPRKLKFTGLIAYVMFYKIREFESLKVINDVIMTSLPKTMGKCGILH